MQFLLFHVISLVVAWGKEGYIKYIPGKHEKALSRASNITLLLQKVQVAPIFWQYQKQYIKLRNAYFFFLPPPAPPLLDFRTFRRHCTYVIDPNLKHCVNKTGLLAILRDITANKRLFMFFMHRQLTLIWTITSLTIIL